MKPIQAGLFALLVPALVLAQADPQPAPPSESQPESQPTQEPAPAETVDTIPVAPAEPAAAAEPQTADDVIRLDTIEVTASKRAKAQRDIPGSVGAIRGENLERMRAQGLSDYLKLVPGVSMADYGTDRQVPVIRGIASGTDRNQFTAYTTGVYLEEMPFNDLFLPLSVPDLNPFDLERVEVLKGPQGTLFGAGALAGAIRYIAQKPNLGVWQAKLSTTLTQNDFSEEPTRTGALAVNAPVGSAAAVRVVGIARRDAGLYDSRPNGGNTRDEDDVDRFDQATGRALASWDISDTLSLQALAFGQETTTPDDGNSNSPERFDRNDTPFAGPTKSRFQGGSLSATKDFDLGRLFYGVNRLDKRFRSMGRNEPALPDQLGNQEELGWYSYINGTIEGLGHELRFSSPDGGDDRNWDWLVGAAHYKYEQAFFQFSPLPGPADQGYYADPPEDRDDVPEEARPVEYLYATVDAEATEQSVFGELTGRLGSYFEATVGARVFETELHAQTLFQGAQITALSAGSGTEQRTQFDLKEDGVNPKASLRYLHSSNIQAYVLAARGFQFGGVQINPPLANIEQATEAKGFRFGPYKSSELWNYELGLRTEWLDRRLRFDVTAFYLDWKDLQLTIQVPINPVPIPPNPGNTPQNVPLDVIVNVGAAHSEGLEAALEVVPFAGVTFSSSAAWISALIDEEFDFDNPEGPVRAGTRLPSTPRFQWSNVVAFDGAMPFFPDWRAGFALTHVHIGESPNDLRPVRTVGGYDTLDARMDLARPGLVWLPEVGLGVNNLTDVRAVTSYTGDGTTNFYYLVRPRTTLLTLAWQY